MTAGHMTTLPPTSLLEKTAVLVCSDKPPSLSHTVSHTAGSKVEPASHVSSPLFPFSMRPLMLPFSVKSPPRALHASNEWATLMTEVY